MKRHATRGDARSGAATIDTQRATMFVIDSSARCGENRTGRAESVVRVRRSPDANDALGESYTRFRRARDDIAESAFVELCEVTSLIRFNRARHSIEVRRELVGIAARDFTRISLHLPQKTGKADGRVNANRRDPRHRERARACRHFTTARIDGTNTSQAEVRCHSPSHASLRALRRVESIARSALFIASKNASGRTRASRLIGHDATTSRRGLNRP